MLASLCSRGSLPSARRLLGTLSTKQGNHVWSKGTGALKGGAPNSKGRFVSDPLKKKYIQFSPALLEGFPLRAYVSKQTPKLGAASAPKLTAKVAESSASSSSSSSSAAAAALPQTTPAKQPVALYSLRPDKTLVPWTPLGRPRGRISASMSARAAAQLAREKTTKHGKDAKRAPILKNVKAIAEGESAAKP